MLYTLSVGDADEGSGLGFEAETGEEGGIVKHLAGQPVARRIKPGMLVLLYLVSWESGNLFCIGILGDLPVRVVAFDYSSVIIAKGLF